MKILDIFLELWQTHSARILGIVLGLSIGIMFLTLGFFSTVLLLFLMSCGYILGKKIDDKEDLKEILDKILPQGFK